MDQIKVFGHIAPDTDTVCSAIVYAWYLTNIKGVLAKAYRLGELNKETEYVLKWAGVDVPEFLEKLEKDDRVAIVDTNNAEELIDLSGVEIDSIVDHHKLAGNISTAAPVEVTIRPVACTASIIYSLADALSEEMPEEILKLILAAIISDTLMFRSPTTTDFDKEIAEVIASELGIDIKELSEKMFAAKSDLSGMSAKDLVLVDSKVIDLEDKKYRISVLETTKPNNALEMKDDIKVAMKEIAAEEGLDDVFFFVIDILNEDATLIVSTDSAKAKAENSFGVAIEDDKVILPGVVSRKKQIIPALSK